MSKKSGGAKPPATVEQLPTTTDGRVDFSKLSDEQRLDLMQQFAAAIRIEKTFIGPIPPPQDFEKYELTLPGAADRILSMAEKEQQIRADGEEGIMSNDRKRIHGATLLGLALVVAAGIAAWKGYPSIAIPLGLSGMFSAVVRNILTWLSSRRNSE